MVGREGEVAGRGLGVEQAGGLAHGAVPARSRVQQVVDAAALAAGGTRGVRHSSQGGVIPPRGAARAAARIALGVARGQVRVDEPGLVEHRQRRTARRVVQVAADHGHGPGQRHLPGELQHLAGLAGPQAASGVARGRAQLRVAVPIVTPRRQMGGQEVDHPDRRGHPHQVRGPEPVGQDPPLRADHLERGQHDLPVKARIVVPDKLVTADPGLAGDQRDDPLVGFLNRHQLGASGRGELCHEQRHPLTHLARVAPCRASRPVQDVLADETHRGNCLDRGSIPSGRLIADSGRLLGLGFLSGRRFDRLLTPVTIGLPGRGLRSIRLLGRAVRRVLDACRCLQGGILPADRRLGFHGSLHRRRRRLPVRPAASRGKDQGGSRRRAPEAIAP